MKLDTRGLFWAFGLISSTEIQSSSYLVSEKICRIGRSQESLKRRESPVTNTRNSLEHKGESRVAHRYPVQQYLADRASDINCKFGDVCFV